MTRPGSREVLNLAGGLLAMALVGILSYLSYALITLEIPKANENLVFALVGGVMTLVTQVVGFYFGSSHTNKQQSETLDKLADTAKQATQSAVPTPTVKVGPGEQVTVESRETL